MFAGINKWICIFIYTIQIFWHNVTANVMVTLELLHYQATPENCCDKVFFICSECDPFLQVCISNRCQQTSRENDKSSIDLTNSLIRPHVFTELFNVWNGDIEIRIKATDYDTVGNDFIDEVHLNYSAPHSSKSNIITLTGKKLTITARITVDCITNFYGPQCTRYCQNTDHGKCDSSGNLTCQAGYFGQNCSLSSSTPAHTLTSKQLLTKSMLTMESNGNASKSVRTTMPSTPITQPKTVISTSITVRNLMYVTYPNISTNERTIPSSTNVQTQMVSTTISNTKPTIMTLVSSRKIEPTRVLSTIASLTEPIINIIRKSSTTLATLTKTTMTESSIQKSENAAETTAKSTHISTTQPTTLRSLTTESSTGTSTQALTAIKYFPDSRTEPTTMTMTKASTSKEHTSSTEVSTSNARTSSREASANNVHTSSREVSTNKVHTSSSEASSSKKHTSYMESSISNAHTSSTEASTSKAQTSSTEASTSKQHNSSTEALTSKAHILSTEASSNKVYNSSRESSTSIANTSSTEAFASKSHTLISTTMPTSTSIISSTAHSMSSTISKASIIEPTIVLSTTMSTNTTKSSRKTEQMTVEFLTTSAVPNITTPTYTPTFKQTRLLAASSMEPRTVESTITSTATFTPIQTMATKPYKIKSTISSTAHLTPKTTSQTSTTAASQMTTTVSTATSTPKPLTILKTEPNTVTSTKSSTTEATSVSRTSTWTNDTTTLTSTTSSTTISIRKTNETTTPHQTTMLPTATDQTTIVHQQTSRNELNSIISTSKVQNEGPTIASKPEQTTDTATNAPTTKSLSLTSTKYSITGTTDRSSTVSTDEATTVYTVYSTIQPKSVLNSAEHSNELTTLTSIKMLTNESNKSHQTTSKNETATVKCKTTSKTVSTVASTTSIKEPTILTSEANTLPKTNTVAIKPMTKIPTSMPITIPATKTLVTTLQIEQDTVIPSINFTPEPKKVRSTTISLHEPTTVRSTASSATKPTTVILKTDPATKIMTLIFKTTSRTERSPLVSIQSLNTKETIVTSTRTTTGSKEPSSKASTTQPKLLRSSDVFFTETSKTTSKETSTTKRTTLTTTKLTMQPTPVSENRQTAVSFINISVLIPTTMISSTSSTTEPTITNPASKTHTTLSATEPTMMTSTSVSRTDFLTTIHSTKLTTEAINMTFRTISATQPTTVASTTSFTSKAIAETLPLFSNRTQTAQTFLNTVITELITNISTTKETNKMNVISVTEPSPTSTLDSNTRPSTSFKPGSIKIPNTVDSMTESTAAMSKTNAAETTKSMSVKTSTKNNTSRVISTRSTTPSNKSFEKSSTTEPTIFTSTLASISTLTIVATKMATGSSTPKYRTLSSTPTVKSGQAISSLLIKGDVRVHLDQVKKVIARLISSSPSYKESDSLSISANSKIVLGNNGEKVTQIIYTVSYAGNNLTAEEISRMVNDPTSNIQTLSSALATIGMQQYNGEITDATTQNDKNWIEEHVGVVAGVGSAILLLLVLSVVCIVRRKRSVHKEQEPDYPVDDDVSFTSGNQELKGIKSDFNGHIATGALKSKVFTFDSSC